MNAIKIKILTMIFLATIMSMFLVTKWWFVLPVDGPDKMFWGFPFAFMGEGFHTSMSYQFFLLEFLFDFLIYFSFWGFLFWVYFKSYRNIEIHKIIYKLSFSVALTLLFGFGIYASVSNPLFHSKRSFEWKVFKTGYIFIWQLTPRPIINFNQPFENK